MTHTSKRAVIQYTSLDILECLNASDTVNNSFQTVLNQLYTDDRLNEVITACNTLRTGLGTGKELNRKLDIIRTQVKRTCKVHDVPVVGIKWDKAADSFSFVPSKPKADKEKDMFKSAVATFIGKGATDKQKAMVMRLMTSIMSDDK